MELDSRSEVATKGPNGKPQTSTQDAASQGPPGPCLRASTTRAAIILDSSDAITTPDLEEKPRVGPSAETSDCADEDDESTSELSQGEVALVRSRSSRHPKDQQGQTSSPRDATTQA
jgi:hypothetical protein